MNQKEVLKSAGVAETFLAGLDDKFIEEAIRGTERGDDGKVIAFAKQEKTAKKKFMARLLKIAACVAAVLVVGFTSLSVATATGSLKAYEFLYKLNPYLAEKMVPVEKSSVDQGIEMRIAGICVEGDVVDAYVTLRDLEGDRIDGTTDLFDSYSIETNCDQWGGCSLVDYDEETRTATFLLKMGLYDQQLGGKKMTFRVRRFLSGKQEMETLLPQIDLKAMPMEEAEALPSGELKTRLGSSRSDMVHSSDDELVPRCLVPNEAQKFKIADGANVTAYGIVDGKLHVQVYYEDVRGRDDHGDVHLINSDGEWIIREAATRLWDKDRIGWYEEYVFGVPLQELDQYEVGGYFSLGAKRYEGDWKISFPFTNVESMEVK
ncbi:MAG: hypothetical protein K6F51_00995 [Acetatifactor sp.]|nr:hypothetical protein [Acetatifactor sp.]